MIMKANALPLLGMFSSYFICRTLYENSFNSVFRKVNENPDELRKTIHDFYDINSHNIGRLMESTAAASQIYSTEHTNANTQNTNNLDDVPKYK